MEKYRDDLWLAALNLGPILPPLTFAFSEVRDANAADGFDSLATFYGEIMTLLADARDHARAA